MKNFKSLSSLIIVLLGVIFIQAIYTSCCLNSKDSSRLRNKESLNIEEQQIARFLVNISKANFKSLELTNIKFAEKTSKDIIDLIKFQENKIFIIQNEITKIAENKLVTIPSFDFKLTKSKIINEANLEDLIFQLTKNLGQEINLLEQVSEYTSDEEIISFKNKYLPEIKSIVEDLENLKINKQLKI